MSLYSALLFVHFIAAFIMIGGNTVSRVGLSLMRSATNGGEAIGAYRAYMYAPKLLAPSVAVTVLTGLYLAWDTGFMWTLWAPGSVVLWILLNIWRVVVVLPPTRALNAAAQQAAVDPAAHGGALIAAARHPRLHFGHLGMELTNFVIIVLMVFKPV